jgi:CBS domain-containing protein
MIMLVLRDFMTREVATLNVDDSLRDAITLLSERYISGAPVLSGDTIVGVVSAMDIMEFAANVQEMAGTAHEPDEWAVDETPEESASSYFTDLWDEGAGLLDEEEGAHDVLGDHTVAEVMTRSLLILPPDTEVHVAAAFMIENGVHRVIVASDGRLEGLVTTSDFMRLIADRRL